MSMSVGGHAWRHIFMACSKLEAMAIYVVKQACDNEIMPSLYVYVFARVRKHMKKLANSAPKFENLTSISLKN